MGVWVAVGIGAVLLAAAVLAWRVRVRRRACRHVTAPHDERSARSGSVRAMVSGLVVDATGRPLKRTRVTLSGLYSETEHEDVVRRTDRRGRFRVTVRQPGEYHLAIQKRRYAPEYRILTVTAGGVSEVRTTLEKGCSVEGRVTLDDQPVANTMVSVFLRTGDDLHDRSSTDIDNPDMTDARGFFRINDLPAGCTMVLVCVPAGTGKRWKSVEVTLTPDRVTNADIILRTGSASLEGHVTDGSGAPIDHARISVSPASAPEGSRADFTASTDGTGHYRFDGLVPGPATVRATVLPSEDVMQPANALHSYRRCLTVELVDGEVTRGDIVFAGTCSVACAFTHVPEDVEVVAFIAVTGRDGAAPGAVEADVSHDGRPLSINGLPVGAYTVRGSLHPGRGQLMDSAECERLRALFSQYPEVEVAFEREGETREVTLDFAG